MVSKKEPDNKKDELFGLTEWQKRNIEFLKKKEVEKLEQKKQQEKLRLERIPTLKGKGVEDKTVESPEIKKTAYDETTEKTPPHKQKKNKKPKTERLIPLKYKRRAYPVFLIAGIVFLVSLFLVTPFSKQKKIVVSGVSPIRAQAIMKASQIKTSDYFFSLIFHHSRYEKNIIKQDKLAKAAQLLYRFPNHFTIKVKEYAIVAYTKTDKGYRPIIENGVYLDTIDSKKISDSDLIITLSSKSDIKKLIKSFSKMDKNLVSQIKEVSSAKSATTKDLLLLKMRDGNTVRVPLSEIVKKLPYYTKIKQNLTENSIVDMEAGLYTTTESIEAQIIADKEKEKSKGNKSDSDATKTNQHQDDTTEKQDNQQEE